MSRALTFDVAGYVIHHKALILADILPAFPGSTKTQIQDALQAASARRIVRCIKAGKCFVWGPMDVTPSDYLHQHLPKGVSSVFDMSGVVLPQTRGTRHAPLGAW